MKWFYRAGIGFYQNFISPKKGFRCAHSLEHGGPGCSGAVLRILEENGLRGGYSLISQRFADCSDSAQKRREREERKRQKEKKSDSCAADSCVAVDCLECLPRLPRLPKFNGDCVPDCSCDGGLRYIFRAKG